MSTIAEVMKMIREDCERDANAVDGKPFTGKSVGEQFGATLAMVSAVAEAVAILAEKVELLDGRLTRHQDKALDAVVRDPESWQAVADAGRRSK